MEPDDYDAMLTPRDPAWTDPTPQLLEDLQDRLRQLAHSTAERVSVRADAFTAADEAEDDGEARTVMWEETQDVPLALLRVLREVPGMVEALAVEAAAQAGEHGAGYPQMGAAYGISRQAARKKWPGVIHILGGTVPDPVLLEMEGGEAFIHFDPEEGGWAWRATAATGRTGAADEGVYYDTSHEASAHAGVFLTAHRSAGREVAEAIVRREPKGRRRSKPTEDELYF